MQLLTQDEELFDDNPFEFVRRDVEGSDADTRRRIACEFVRALCRNYESQVSSVLSGYIGQLLTQAASSCVDSDSNTARSSLPRSTTGV